MTKFNIKTTSSSYLKEKETFISELRHFHDVRGSTIRNIPMINSKEIDLYHLYLLVTHHGGWVKVNNQGLWDSLLKPLSLPATCVNGGVGIRQIYLRFLERWERAKGGGEGGGGAGGAGGEGGDDGEDDRHRRAAWGAPRPRNTVPLTYNHNQHNVPDNVRESVGLAPLHRLSGGWERLALSLLSPLPNEQDFALNVCTILAADVNNKLPLHTTPHIVDFLLGHAAVYNHTSLRDVIGKSYKEARSISMETYWIEHTNPAGILELLDERRFPIHGLAMRAIMSHVHLNTCLVSGELPVDDKDLPIPEEINLTADEDDGIMGAKCHGGARDVISRRIQQVATIMRNLSFHEDNLSMLAKHQTYVRFLLLCVNCRQSGIRQMGLDALGNVAQELQVKDPATCLLSRHLLSTLTSALYSEDRARILASLEVLNKLSQNENNEDILLRYLEQKIYEQVCSYLTLHDIMLLVVTLECVYSLTSLGERACDYIVKVHGVVDTLVSLITVEAQSYGPKACILMRVVETVPGGVPINPPHAPSPPPMMHQNTNSQASSFHQLQSHPTHQQLSMQPMHSGNMAQAVGNPATVPSTSGGVLVTQGGQQQQHNKAQDGGVGNPTQVSIQQQHAHQQAIQENEQFALAWLRSTWEPCAPNIRLDSAELYKQYIACCQKVGRKGVISPLHFPRCVRSVFGGMVGPNPIKTVSGETQQCYMGIKLRASALNKPATPTNTIHPVKPGPSSPILKAQLAKTDQNKMVIETPTSPPPTQQVTPTPLSPPGSAGGPTNTSLIKHLLAHKVTVPQGNTSDRMPMQVTQRQAQNQQRMLVQANTNQNPPQNVVSMEVDAEALISCSTITASGVTSTSPAPQANKGPSVPPPLMPINKNIKMIKQEELSEGVLIEAGQQGEDATPHGNTNKMLTDLLEKQSSPPMLLTQRVEDRKPSRDDSDEPPAKMVKTESVSSKAANLYAALAADALEDEEDLIIEANAESQQIVQIVQPPGQAIHQPSQIVQGQIIQHGGQIIQQSGQVIQQTGQINQQVGHQQVSQEQQHVIQQQQQGSVIQQNNQIVQAANTVIQQSGQAVSNNSQIIQQGQIVQSGQIVQQGGQIVQQGGQIVQSGQIVQQGGQIVQSGQIVQQGGQIVQSGQIVQQGGQIVQQAGQIVQQSGHIVQQGGQIIQQTGQATVIQQQPGQIIHQPGQVIQQGVIQGQIIQQGGQIIQQGGQIIQQGGQIIQQGGQVVQQIVQQGQVVQQQNEGQIVVPAISNQSGQLILHGLSFMQSGMVPHKTIIILQSGNGPNSPMTLTVNNAGGLDENTLNSLISQATEAISMQKQAQGGTTVIQNTGQIIQSGGGGPPTMQGMIQASPGPSGTIIKQQIIQGQAQVVPSQQPIITHQPQPQIISPQGHQVPGNQQVLVQSTTNNQQIVVGNQQIVVGNQQLVVGGAGQSNVTAGGATTQQIISQGQQQNRQQFVVSQGQGQKVEKKIVTGTPQMVQGQKIIVQSQNVQPNKPVVVTQQAQQDVKPQVKKIPDEPWVCQWRGCDMWFESAGAVYSHACAVHCNKPELPCLWANCDQLPRKKFSLMTHLQDRHCSTEALKAAHIQRKKGLPPTTVVSPPPPSTSPPNTTPSIPSSSSIPSAIPPNNNSTTSASGTSGVVGGTEGSEGGQSYATNAALHAIKRHAVDFLNPRELMDDNEGPVTKSIRLTAALILRNIVIYSHTGRRLLRGYEPHLAGIALSTVEASRTVAQILYDMNC